MADVSTLTTTGFNCSTQTTQSNYGVNPNYRLGMVQVYNLGIQRTLPQGIVLNIDYTGAYAGNQDIAARAEPQLQRRSRSDRPGSSRYEDSLGYQRSNALAVNARERMHKGVCAAGDLYLFALDRRCVVGGRQRQLDRAERPEPGRGGEQLELRPAPCAERQLRDRASVRAEPRLPEQGRRDGRRCWTAIRSPATFTFASGGYATPTLERTAR